MLIPIFLSAFVLFTLLVLMSRRASAHCDTEDRPAVNDGRKALQTGVANDALKWILHEADAELRPIFDEAMKVGALGPDAADLANRHSLENLARIHRAGEGLSYDGIKATGTAMAPEVVTADEAMQTANLKPVMDLVPGDKHTELLRRFDTAWFLTQFAVNDLASGCAYVAAMCTSTRVRKGRRGRRTITIIIESPG